MARATKASSRFSNAVPPLSLVAGWVWVGLALALLLVPGVVLGVRDRLAAQYGGGQARAARLLLAGDAETSQRVAFRLEAALSQGDGPRLEVLPAESAESALQRLLNAEADFALVSSLAGPLPAGVRAVAALAPRHLHVLVPATAEARHLRDLGGLRVGIGPLGSADALLARAIFDYYGFVKAPVLVPVARGALRAAFGSGEIDAALLLDGVHTPGLDALLAAGYYRLLPLDDAPALALRHPETFAAELPPALYGPDRSLPPAEAGAWPTLGVHSILAARAGAPEQAVLAALRGLPDAAEVPRWLGEPDPAAVRHFAGAPPAGDPLGGWGAPLLGAALLAGALPFAASRSARWRAARQRRAIDRFFSGLADYAAAIESADSPQALATILHDMTAAQRRAERLWLAGHLASGDVQTLFTAHAGHAGTAVARMTQLHLLRVAAIGGAGAPSLSPGDLAPAPIPDRNWGAAEPAARWPHEDNLSHALEAWDAGDGALLDTVRVRGRESATAAVPASTAGEDGGEDPEPPAAAPHRAELRAAAPHPREKRRGKGKRRKRREESGEGPDPAPAAPAAPPRPKGPKADQLDLF
jgi:TRAP-type uncharacterized transport system substrate-binding protein